MSDFQIKILKDALTNDRTSFFYNGEFDDDLTFEIISLLEADQDLGKKEKRRMGYVLAESFQNVVRHGLKKEEIIERKVFGIRNNHAFGEIFSSNIVSLEDKNFLEDKLSTIGTLNNDELKSLYLDLLTNNKLSEKGGAGLGLVEMARKSKLPLQYKFTDFPQKDYYAFNMQIDFSVKKNEEEVTLTARKIEENIQLGQLVLEGSIVFFYKGQFDDEMLAPMMKILESNSSEATKTSFNVFHSSVELMQNVSRHGIRDENGVINGVFCLEEFDDYYYLTIGNYATDKEFSILEKNFAALNKMSKSELDELYRKSLKLSLLNDTSSAKVGLIDLKRCNPNSKLELSRIEEEGREYLIIGVKIEK